MITFSMLPAITQGKIIEMYHDTPIETLLTDSRKVWAANHALFFAIKGERHNGANFLEEVYKLGVRQFIVEKYTPKMGLLTEANFFEVPNAVTALQDLAAHARANFSIPVFGITGSNGKTIVKEWLSQLLTPEYTIIKSPKSYNSQIGVPLSVWQMNSRHTLGVFEAGISKVGEMQRLERIIKPTLGIFTNIGTAHDEGFSSTEQKILEKLSLFNHCQKLIYCKDHQPIHTLVEKKQIPGFTWSALYKADVEIKKTQTHGNKTYHLLRHNQPKKFTEFEIEIPFADAVSIENLMQCVAAMLYLGIPTDAIQLKINRLKKVSTRLEVKQGINHCYLVDDSYQNDFSGFSMAVDFLMSQNQKTDKSVILSDLSEAGINPKELYTSVAKLLIEKNINKVIAIGPELFAQKDIFSPLNAHFYLSTNVFLQHIQSHKFFNEVILVKGAREYQFEKIVAELQQKSHGTVLEINLDALAHNLNFYRKLMQPGTKIMAMVKSFAYGSGHLEVAQLLQFQRVDYLAVAYADEGVNLRENGIHLPIMVMNTQEENFDAVIKHDLEPVVFSIYQLQKWVQFLENYDQTIRIHLELETGMNRLGLPETELVTATDIIKKSGRITVVSIFSHLAGADSEEHTKFSNEQYFILNKCAYWLENNLKYKIIKHLLNSPGITRFPEFQLDMVRLGIGLYGVEANGLYQKSLLPVSTLKTTISQIKKLSKKDTVGYGRVGKVAGDTTIAVLAIGYGDGFSRSFSNGKGKVYIKGQLAPVIGNVCMDMTMVNITHIPDVKEGDEAEIFGTNLSIIELAQWINTIPYEILTQVSERVKRVFYAE